MANEQQKKNCTMNNTFRNANDDQHTGEVGGFSVHLLPLTLLLCARSYFLVDHRALAARHNREDFHNCANTAHNYADVCVCLCACLCS